MTERAVRVSFQHVEEPNEAMQVDVVLSGNRVKPGQEYYGVWEHKGENIRCPFILTTDGDIDYGFGHADDDQIYETDFLEKDYTVGAEVTCAYEDDEYDYKIVAITPMP